MDRSKEEIEIRVDPSVTPNPFDIFDLSFFKQKKRNEGYHQDRGKEKENEEDEDNDKEEFEWEQATLHNEVGGHLVLVDVMMHSLLLKNWSILIRRNPL